MRRLRFLLPVIVLLPTSALTEPASATLPNPRWCTGEYSLTLGTSIGFAGTAPSGGAGFTLQSGGLLLGSGICSGLTFGNYRIDGELFGWCGLATGYGWRADGNLVDVVWSGTPLQIAGVAVGALHMTTRPAR